MPIFFIIGIVLLALILIWDLLIGVELSDVMVEAHGMLFDLIIFGIILSVYEFYSEKKLSINNYLEQLEALREWDGEEEAFRVKYAVGQLEKLDYADFDLAKLRLGNLQKEKIKEELNKRHKNICAKGQI